MPRIPQLALASLLLPATAVALDVASRVDAVTVYPRGASVTRAATIELPAGTTTIRLAGLPDNLDPSLLRSGVEPVARNEDIEVEVGRGATAPDETGVDEKPGVVLWRRAVEPGETWAIEHSCTISYPADRVLTRR